MDIDTFLEELFNSQDDWTVTTTDVAYTIDDSLAKEDSDNEE